MQRQATQDSRTSSVNARASRTSNTWHPTEISRLEWLDLPATDDDSATSLFGLSNLFHSLIHEAEQELASLESESECDEDAPAGSTSRRSSQGSVQPAATSKQSSDIAALREFLHQCRSYIQTFKSQMLSCLPESSVQPQLKTSSQDSLSAEQEASRLLTSLQRVHDLLCLLAHKTSNNISERAAKLRDGLPSPSTESLRAASQTFLASLPEPPTFPLDRLRAALSSKSGTISSAMSSVGMQFSPSRQRLAELASNLTPSHAMELVGQAGEVVSEEAHKLKDKVAEETEKLGHLIGEEAEKFKKALQEGANRLLHYDDLPNLWKNNEYILSGYRFIPIERWSDLLLSLFKWHNETINIYTHLFGGASLIYLMYCLHPLQPLSQSEHLSDRIVSLSFLTCALACMAFSSVWHLMAGCATFNVFNRSACLDYVGVSGLICCSIFTMIWYGFYCRSDLLEIYATIAFAVGIAGVVLPWQEWFNKRENKGWRVVFFLSMCLSAIVPQTHMILLYGMKETVIFYFPVLMSALAYIVGLLFYGSNMPEKLRPGGFFDTLFHSHQWWHVAIVVAVWLHYWALTVMHDQGTVGFSCAAPTQQSRVISAFKSEL